MEKGVGKGLLEAVHIAPLFTLTSGLREAQGGHMPNSPGGQSCPALSLTSLPAPLFVCLPGCISGRVTSLFSGVWIEVFAFVKYSSRCYFT